MASKIWWLASYPKSGNTWLRLFVASVLSGRPADINRLNFLGANSNSRVAFDRVMGIEAADLSLKQQLTLRPRVYEVWAADAQRPLYCKAHEAYCLTPTGEPLFPTAATCGAVYVVRDPRAVAVSLAYHNTASIDQAIALMEDPEAVFSRSDRRLHRQLHQHLMRWSEHVESWLSAPFPVHLVRYEDMRADPHAVFAALAMALGLRSDRATIATAVESTSFQRLHAQERASGFVEKPYRMPAFFREGRSDGWRDALKPEQAARIVAVHGDVMRRLGYDPTLAPALCGKAQPSVELVVADASSARSNIGGAGAANPSADVAPERESCRVDRRERC
jgi:aryl sulfotransferase